MKKKHLTISFIKRCWSTSVFSHIYRITSLKVFINRATLPSENFSMSLCLFLRRVWASVTFFSFGLNDLLHPQFFCSWQLPTDVVTSWSLALFYICLLLHNVLIMLNYLYNIFGISEHILYMIIFFRCLFLFFVVFVNAWSL